MMSGAARRSSGELLRHRIAVRRATAPPINSLVPRGASSRLRLASAKRSGGAGSASGQPARSAQLARSQHIRREVKNVFCGWI